MRIFKFSNNINSSPLLSGYGIELCRAGYKNAKDYAKDNNIKLLMECEEENLNKIKKKIIIL